MVSTVVQIPSSQPTISSIVRRLSRSMGCGIKEPVCQYANGAMQRWPMQRDEIGEKDHVKGGAAHCLKKCICRSASRAGGDDPSCRCARVVVVHPWQKTASRHSILHPRRVFEKLQQRHGKGSEVARFEIFLQGSLFGSRRSPRPDNSPHMITDLWRELKILQEASRTNGLLDPSSRKGAIACLRLIPHESLENIPTPPDENRSCHHRHVICALNPPALLLILHTR